jgi:predicted CXXCH cytochrome family protein
MTFFKRASLKLKSWRELILPFLVVGGSLYLGLVLLVACSTSQSVVAPPPVIPGAHFVGSGSCASCHEDITRKFPDNVHARVHPVPGAGGIDTSCESCHGPGSRHVESGGGTPFKRLIVNPGKSPEACFQCHLGVRSQFHLPSHHPVIEGRMNCVDCHDPHGFDIMKPAGGLALSRLNQSCAECHRDQSRSFVFEHEAMRDGCVTCHHPHGSVNDKMLIQRDANLCLKCHAQVPGAGGAVVIGKVDHSFFLRQGSCSTTGCHTAVHGSNIHPKLLH